MAGADPTGWGAVAAGLGDQRNVELLVEAGFTVAEAIQIASANGARFLGQADDIGALMPGRRADLAILRGSLTSDIHTIRNVEIVFKGGVGFDAGRLMHAEHGRIGDTSDRAWIAAAAGLALFVLLVARKHLRHRRTRGFS